ncbi:hypothetical protein J6590_000319 [Homalodisca vitripennis]|nr:hypothetical protein J6590_000319 [Homalodisca vitripennis]
MMLPQSVHTAPAAMQPARLLRNWIAYFAVLPPHILYLRTGHFNSGCLRETADQHRTKTLETCI